MSKQVYDWIIIAVFIMSLECCMFGNSSSNHNWWSLLLFIS